MDPQLSAPVTLRTFGTIRLESVDGPVSGPSAQRHRLALLALLAASPGGHVSRDRVIAMLWPESDGERGRTLLNSALHAIRRQLGSDVIRSVGDGLFLEPSGITTDVAIAERSARDGAPDRAVLQYSGPFLDGFHLPDSPEFEEWADAARAKYQRWIRDLLDHLASPAVTPDARARAGWTARLAEHEPHSANAATRHMRALVDGGERAAAVAFAKRFQERLHEDLGAGSDPDVEALAVEIAVLKGPAAGSSVALVAARVAVAESATGGEPVAPTGADAPGPTRPSPGTAPRRIPWPVVAAIGALAIGSVAVFGIGRGAPAAPFVANTVLVMPFEVRARPELAYLGPGLMDLLSARINGMGPLNAVDPAVLVDVLSRDSSARRTPLARARAAAADLGAERAVVGSLVEAGTRLEIRAGIYDADGDREAEVLVSGSEANLGQLVDDLARQLLAGHLRGEGNDLPSLAATTTGSLEALRAYLDGERVMREGQFAEAFRQFERAVFIDSSFALALYRMGQARMRVPGLRQPWWDRVDDRTAARLGDRLPEFERDLVRTSAMPNSRSLPILRQLVARRPTSAEAWHRLGVALDIEAASQGTGNAEAIAALSRAIALDRAHPDARRALAYAVARAGDLRRLAMLARELEGVSAEDALLARVYLAHARAGQHDIDAVIAELATAPEPLITEAAAAVATITRRPDLTRAVHELFTGPGRTRAVRGEAQMRLADLALAEGRWRDARRLMQVGESMLQNAQPISRARLVIVPFSPMAEAFGDSVRRELFATFAERRTRAPGTGRGIPGLANSAGMISAAQRDSSGVREALDSLITVEGLPIAVRLPDMRAGLEAQVAWIAGNPQRVIDILSNATEVVSDHRFLLARALEAVGRDEEALRWYSSYPDLSLNAVPQLGLVPASLLRIAEIHDRRGERAMARAAREQFLAMWRNADPELQTVVAQVKAKLATVR